MQRILVFDNYDSFTYNLVHLVEKITGEKPDVVKNDGIRLKDAAAYDRIILSPGPGLPSEAGLLIPLIREYAAVKPILGVCLGHQAIGEAFGAKLANLENVYHGVARDAFQTDIPSMLFTGLDRKFPVGRYHSWVIDESSLPADFEVTARDAEGSIMAMQHQRFSLLSVQFHPESVLTPDGKQIMRNWLEN